MNGPTCLNLRNRVPCERPVVAFAQASVADNRKSTIAERDLRSTKRADQVRAEHRRKIIVAPALSEFACLCFPGD